ncbi:MAG: hypothetical protein GWM87_00710 [Xanthomonadales bacterium]|nr:hypothetical protein [Xanthomonadales bacterium]NIX11623.1 hypothetical protein [Xanthomonadales bacterium]
MIRYKQQILFIISAVFLAACAIGADAPQTLEGKLAARNLIVGEPVKRISNYRMDGWAYLDDRHLIIESGASDRYLVSLKTRCDDMRGAINIGFRTYTGSLTDADSVVVRATGGYTRNCLIDTLHELVRVNRDEDNE